MAKRPDQRSTLQACPDSPAASSLGSKGKTLRARDPEEVRRLHRSRLRWLEPAVRALSTSSTASISSLAPIALSLSLLHELDSTEFLRLAGADNRLESTKFLIWQTGAQAKFWNWFAAGCAIAHLAGPRGQVVDSRLVQRQAAHCWVSEGITLEPKW